MNAKLKSTLIILLVLLIGVAIGFELSEISIKREFEKIESFKNPQGFLNAFNRVIKPEQNQKHVTDSILILYHNKVDSVSNFNLKIVSSVMDSMQSDLGKVLTENQKKALAEEMLKMKRHPHPPPPPPDKR